MSEPGQSARNLSESAADDPAHTDSSNLRDVGALASWAVSSAKPGCGVEHIRDPNPATLWQCVTALPRLLCSVLTTRCPRGRRSEGAQPHLINIQFPKKQPVSVRLTLSSRTSTVELTRQRATRASQQVWIYADISQDDSYTPHKVSIRAGTYHGDLHEVRWVELGQPKGWQVLRVSGSARPGEEPLADGCVPLYAAVSASPAYRNHLSRDPIRAHLLQVAIISNHMNGKDTHVRGIRVFAPRP